MNNESERRFGGIARVYGEAGLRQLVASHICVIGIGGVGSWVVECLARSAVGRITLIDMDIVSESNINRQLLATTESLGRDKVLVMRERVSQINAACQVHCVDDFIDRDNIAELLAPDFDFIVDCIDDFRTKAALIAHCRGNKRPILTVGGAGGQTDPGKIHQADLSRTEHDVLLARTRKLLRQDYGFPVNLKRSFGVPCVFSKEQLVYPDNQGGVSSVRPARNHHQPISNALNCAGGIGSITHVTAAFGMHAAAFVLNTLARQ